MRKHDLFAINLRGGLDSVTAPDFIRYLEDKKKEGYYLFLLNCESLEHVTSGGIAALLALNSEKEYFYAFHGLNQEILSLFSLLGILNKLSIFVSRKDAEAKLASLKKIEDETIEPEGQGFPLHASEKSFLEVEEKEPMILKQETLHSHHPAETIVHYTKGHIAEEEQTEKVFASPHFTEKVISCEACGSLLRIRQIGKHQCPGCGIEFDVRSGGSVTYLEKLI